MRLFVKSSGVLVGHNDAGSLRGQKVGDRLTDAIGARVDERQFPLDPIIHLSSPATRLRVSAGFRQAVDGSAENSVRKSPARKTPSSASRKKCRDDEHDTCARCS